VSRNRDRIVPLTLVALIAVVALALAVFRLISA